MKIQDLKQEKYNLLLQKQQVLASTVGVGYRPHAKQMEFHTAGGGEHGGAQERLFLAGNRCGKTLAGCMEVVFHLTGQYPNWWAGARFTHPIHAWAASVTTEATRDILQATYLEHIPQHLWGKVTHKRGVADAVDTIHIQHVSGGYSLLGFKSYDQGREKFQGTARHIIHLDEEPDIGIYEECVVRTMTTRGSILLTMTPLLGMTDLCARFLNTDDDSKQVVRATWEDAPHLNKTEQARLVKTLRPHEVSARRDGEPKLGMGKVYPIHEDELSVPRFEIPPHYRLAYGLDFGWSNPTAAILGAIDDDTDILYLSECYYRAECPPSEHAESLRRFGAWVPGVCDPSGQSAHPTDGQNLMDIYAQHGIVLTHANNSVEAGLMQVLERMRAGKLKIFDDMEPFWREFRTYRRGKGGKIVKTNDHLMDAMRYLVVSGLTLARCAPTRKVIRRAMDWRTV